MIIYKITNKLNGKSYIGQTTRNVRARIAEHKYKKSLVGKAILEFGEGNFKVEKLESCKTLEELNEREAYWIQKMDTIQPKGYNKAIVDSKFGKNNGFFGKSHSNLTIINNQSNQPNRKQVLCVETGKIFISVRECERTTGVKRTKIINHCKSRVKNQKFRYVI
ncbi:GIY-YIG nuclease family protein [Lysinibacillus sp. LZ02]|uniref:GIY-YIG nuclease family protein n=1 Tax=Lysinibacillus sp. LZ02 TaxID=3420668 RepID=UPI003D369947